MSDSKNPGYPSGMPEEPIDFRERIYKSYGTFKGWESRSLPDSVLKSLSTRDSVLPIVALLALAAREKVTPAELINRLPQKYTSSVLVKNCPLEVSAKILEKVKTFSKAVIQDILGGSATVDNTNTLDGVRITTSDGEIVHFRPSGNAPEFRCYVESATQKKADQIATAAKTFIVRLIEKQQY